MNNKPPAELASPEAPAPHDKGFLTRRRAVGLLAAGCAGVVGYTFLIEPHLLVTARVPLAIEGLSGKWSGRKIVQLSDLHIGEDVSSHYIARTLTLVNDLAPDLVVITGDFMSCRGAEQIDEVIRLMLLLNRHTPTVAILGNHDYAAGWSQPAVAEELADRLQEIQIEVLRNQSRDIDGLKMIGLDDLWSGRFNINKVQNELNSEGSRLVLCHNPDAVDLPGWENYRGWVLSGHTHGGQCKPPFLPPPMLPVKNKRYTSGLFDLSAARKLYISRGVGHLLKVRFNCRPEITLFNIEPA